MSFQQIYRLSMTELSQEYDLNPTIIKLIETNSKLIALSSFIYEQMNAKQLSLINAYKEKFNNNIDQLTKTLPYDNRCGFVIDCCSNGYKEYCNISLEHHNNNIKMPHSFQKKNINNIIDQKYQNDILVICQFIIEMTSLLITGTIRDFLLNNSTVYMVEYDNTVELLEYDNLLQFDPKFFRSNFLNNGYVLYYQSKL